MKFVYMPVPSGDCPACIPSDGRSGPVGGLAMRCGSVGRAGSFSLLSGITDAGAAQISLGLEPPQRVEAECWICLSRRGFGLVRSDQSQRGTDLLFDITAHDIGVEKQRTLNCSHYNGGRTRSFRI